MKALLTIVLACMPSVASATAIVGTGTYFHPIGGGSPVWDLTFSGVGDTHNTGGYIGCVGATLSCLLTYAGSVTIDDQYFSFGSFSLSAFSITGFDSQHHVVVSEPIVMGNILGSETCTKDGCAGRFTITTTPEPEMLLLMALGLIGLGIWRVKKSVKGQALQDADFAHVGPQ